MKILDFTVCSNEALNDKNHLIKVVPTNGEQLPEMFPGQFVQVLVDSSPEVFLRRPISINNTDLINNEIWMLIKRIGKGTEKICDSELGDTMNLIFPLGNSFTIPKTKLNPLLVGGGVGTAPLLFLGKLLSEKGIKPGFLIGGQTESDILQLSDFEKYGDVYCTTEDGSFGERGFVTDHSLLKTGKFDFIYTCGPKPMMVAISKYAVKNGIECEASLENLMACGFGACLCCTEKTVRGNVCTCTEGPVFNIKELTWLD